MCKILTDDKLLNSIKSVKYNVEAKSKPGLYVVLTAKNGHTPFWLMTYYDPTVTDIDLSKIPPMELIDIWEKEGVDAAIRAYEDGVELDSDKKQKKERKKHNAKKKNSHTDLIDVDDVLTIDDVDFMFPEDVFDFFDDSSAIY
jgi:hypothetical protein